MESDKKQKQNTYYLGIKRERDKKEQSKKNLKFRWSRQREERNKQKGNEVKNTVWPSRVETGRQSYLGLANKKEYTQHPPSSQ